MSLIDNIIDRLVSTTVEDSSEKEVSFAGQGLSLDTEEDAAPIVKAIQNCPGMVTLKLEGNTFGTPAAKAVAKALESQPDFKNALWKDMFTRRDKDEIPKALSYLSSGIILANAKLVVLDLSDNAFGPRGLVGLQDLLQSSSCYTLEELHLNNNGLGISGAKMLSEAICKCIENSRKAGTPLRLKMFVCGRNRLENQGAIAVSKFLKEIGTLESVAMPQNGIYAPGITQLAEAFTQNPNLKVINLNDNSLTVEGAKRIADCLPKLKQLQLLNLGDCLVRTEGAKALAASLTNNCEELVELNLGYNEIDKEGGYAVACAMENKQHLETLILNGNQFGDEGCQQVEDKMSEIEKFETLGSFSEDEGDDDDDEDEEGDEDEDYKPDEDNEEDGDEEDEETDSEGGESFDKKIYPSPMSKTTTIADFINSPTQLGLVSLHESNQDLISTLPENPTVDDYFELFKKICLVVNFDNATAKTAACQYADNILPCALKAAGNESEFNTAFLVHVGLLKGEDKKPPKDLDITGIAIVLEHAVKQSYFPSQTRDLLQFFLARPLTYVTILDKAKHALCRALY